MKQILLLLILVFPLLLHAQPQVAPLHLVKDSLGQSFHLKDDWKFHSGDSLGWAARGFDDRTWKSVQTDIDLEDNKDKETGFNGKGWFRLHFTIDSSLSGVPLALEIQQGGASAIYIDGNFYKQYGKFRTKEGHYYMDPQSEPLIFSLSGAGEHVLAVRYENYTARKRFERFDEHMAGFTMAVNEPDVSVDAFQKKLRITSVMAITSGSIFMSLFIVHLILFIFYREVLSNLLFSLFNLGFAIFFLALFYGLSGTSVAGQDRGSVMINVALSISCFAISALVNNLFAKHKLRFKLLTCLCAATILFTFIKYSIGGYFLAVTTVLCALEAAILVCIAMYRKVKGAGIIGVGILFFVFFFGALTLFALFTNGHILLDNSIIAVLSVVLAIMAIFSIPFSMSAYLAWNFATVNKNLKTQLRQVEVLSYKTIQQEQEKQQLLENRKEELEKEVAQRTEEILEQKGKIEQQHEDLKAEKKKSDDLLLNILPAEVAEELKESGTTKARHFDHVTVLFTDFVNFTQISERLSPEVLVQELDECFRAFDEIIERNGMEKIKTIGDAYLAVSGMPIATDRHAFNAVKAGLEIVDFMKERSTRSVHGNVFEVRIGINSGPLVAGIVGVKKFAYDIWGDTVNMASRMESNSEPGRINISEHTHELVLHDFKCTYRGKINAKNKGDVDMYFVDGLI
jgi:adenylate cyclase